MSKINIVAYVVILVICYMNAIMKRRTFAMILGVSVLSTGCLSTNDDADPNRNVTDGSDIDGNTTDETPLKEFSVGESNNNINPHQLSIENHGDDSRTVALRITNVERNETVLDRSFVLAGDKVISGNLREPTEYRVTVNLAESGKKHSTVVSHFDTCNEYGTTVTLSSNGTITSEMISTTLACDPT